MRRSFPNFLLVLLVVGLGGTALTAVTEQLFGVTAVFFFAVIIALVAGVSVIIAQITERVRKNRSH